MPSHLERSAAPVSLEQAQRLHQQFSFGAAQAYRQRRGQVAALVGLTLVAVLLAATLLQTSDNDLQRTALVGAGLGITLVLALLHRPDPGDPQAWAAAAAQVERLVSLGRGSQGGWGQVALPLQRLRQASDPLPLAGASATMPLPPVLRQGALWQPTTYRQQRLQPAISALQTTLTKHQRQRQWLRLLAVVGGATASLLPLAGPDGLIGTLVALPAVIGLTLWQRAIVPTGGARQQSLSTLLALDDHWRTLAAQSTAPNTAGLDPALEPLLMATEAALIAQFGPQWTEGVPDAHTPTTVEAAMDTALQRAHTTVLTTTSPDLASDLDRVDQIVEVEVKEPATEPAPSLPAAAEPDPATSLVHPTPSALAALVGAPSVPSRSRPHAFVVMPFGRKPRADGSWVDFNAIYTGLIKPAIEAAGFESFRADEETCSGDILTDMFQELLLADVVVADLSIDNANVFYELGVRHAMRRRGIVHIQAGRAYMPFDIFNVRTLPYHCDASGGPDAAMLEKDFTALVKMIQSTWQSDHNQIHSPIFNLLNGLTEPNRKSLRTPLATGYWEEYNTLQGRIAIAQRQKRIGDVVLLAEEVSNPLIKEDILSEAGQALKAMGNSALALKQYRQGLKINPNSLTFSCEEAYHLHRLGQSDEAIVKLERLLQDHPAYIDASCYLGLIYQDIWREQWVAVTDTTERLKLAYDASYLLVKAIDCYLRAYQLDTNLYLPGVHALALTTLLDHLADANRHAEPSPDELTYRQMLPSLVGSLQFCLDGAELHSPEDSWAALARGVLALCTAQSPTRVGVVYKRALTYLWSNRFALQDALQQLQLFKHLDFRPSHVQAGMTVLQAELSRYEQQAQIFATDGADDRSEGPVQVFLFAGHMIDSPSRETPRFPAAMEEEAATCINAVLDKLQANGSCIALTPGIACGGDIIFIEACLARDVRVESYLPFDVKDFIQDSVSFAGDEWVERFYNIVNHPNVSINLQPERLGPVPEGDNAYERNNRWALYSTLMYDINRVRLVVLWNGVGGDAPGGTGDMVNQVRQLGGMVEHIDTSQFDHWKRRSANIETIYEKLQV